MNFSIYLKKVGGSRWSFDKIIFDLDFFMLFLMIDNK